MIRKLVYISTIILAVFFFFGSASAMTFQHVMNIGSAGTGEGQFKYVEDFAFDGNGYILATDAAHAHVQVFDKKSGKFIR